MVRFHQVKKSVAIIIILKVPDPSNVGIVEVNSEGRVLGFVEKPPPSSRLGNMGNGGVYVLGRVS